MIRSHLSIHLGSDRDGGRLTPSPPFRGGPMSRLAFWKVTHPLIYRLERYEATRIPVTFRPEGTLQYWKRLGR